MLDLWWGRDLTRLGLGMFHIGSFCLHCVIIPEFL